MSILKKAGIKWNTDYLLFIIAVLLYILFVIIFVFFMKHYAGKYVLMDVDKRLVMVAKSLPLVLPENYHDRAVDPGAVSEEEWLQIENKMTELARVSGVRYVWTDVLINNKVYMTSCNRTEQTHEEGLKLFYFMPYEQGVSGDEFSAFFGTDPVFANFRDKWGSFRAVFIPYVSPGGKKYLACAEYTTDYVEGMINEARKFSILIAVFFFLVFLPVFIVYIRNSKNESQRLEEKELNLRITLDSIEDGVIVTDNAGIITIFNPAAERITGWAASKAVNMEVSDVLVICKSCNSETSDSVENINNDDKIRETSRKAKLIAKDGNEKTVAHTRAPISKNDGHVIGSVIVISDISEMMMLEEELRQSQKMESIGQLASGIAHDFNNMLGAIMGSAEFLRTYCDSDTAGKENIDLIFKASEKASEMIHKLLAFSRKEDIKKEVIDIHRCIENSFLLLQRSIDRKIEIAFSLNAEKHFIFGDSTLVENSLLNLGINARDAMPEGGLIRIETKNVSIDSRETVPQNFNVAPGDYIKVEIKDTGSGIPEKIRNKIFEPFFTTKEKGKGTGLGLSLVYGTVKNHEGMIKLSSEDGNGTTFILFFPVAEKRGQGTKKESVDFKGRGSILLVDDEELILIASSNILKKMSYEVITASDGIKALEIFQKNREKIRVAIIDMIMPGMSGIELFKKMKELDPDLNIIFSSGFSNEETMNEIMSLGAAGIVFKPYSTADIAEVLRKVEMNISESEYKS